MSEYCSNCAGVAERYEDQVDRLDKRIRALEADLARCRSAIAHDTQATRRIADLKAALREIHTYAPGNFRPLQDEIAIWRIADTALNASAPETKGDCT